MIAALGLQVWLHTYATNGVSDDIAQYVLRQFTQDSIGALLVDPDRCVLVAMAPGNLLGYATLAFAAEHSGITTEIETLYVQEHFLRKGIGSALLYRAINEARSRTASADVWLSVNANNGRAIAFYDAAGFVADGEMYFDLNGTRHRNIILVAREAAQG